MAGTLVSPMSRPLAMVALLYLGGVLLGEFFSLLPPPWLFAISLALAAASLFWTGGRIYLLCLLVLFAGWTNLATRSAVLSPHDLRLLVIVPEYGRLLRARPRRS